MFWNSLWQLNNAKIIFWEVAHVGTKHYFSLSLPYPGYSGDCGTVLSCDDPGFDYKGFCAIHFYGNEISCSGFTIVTQELLSSLIGADVKTFQAPPEVPQEIADDDPRIELLPVPPGATKIKTLVPRSRVSHDSSIRQTPFFARLNDPKRRPAILSHHQDPLNRDPMLIGMKKQIRIPFDIDAPTDELLRACAKLVLKHDKQKAMSLSTLDVTVAVLGNAFIQPMVLDSAAGYPWNTMKTSEGKAGTLKSDWIKVDRIAGTVTIDPVIEQAISDAMECYRSGKIPKLYYAGQLKDELRSHDRVDACKTRIFYVGCIVITIVGRMLFSSIVRSFELSRSSNPGKMSVAVGIDPRDPIIPMIYGLCTGTKPVTTIALDQEGFDYHQDWKVAKYLVEPINRRYCPTTWKTDPNCIARATYLEHMYNATVAVDGYEFQHPGGLMSGCPITAPFNSLYLELVTLACMTLVTNDLADAPGSEYKRLGPTRIKKFSTAVYYGDDSLIICPAEWKITAADLIAKYLKFGMKATHCIKDADINRELTFDEVSFLKRKWGLLEGRVVWRRALEDIYDGLNYAHKSNCNDSKELMKTITNLLNDISLYGEEEYTKFRDALHVAFHALGWPYDLDDYKDFRRFGPAGTTHPLE
nr:MAG: nonstructural protein [Riboviria sp.]WKV33074.1 MAG: RNA-dependent RNA polymerase [Riboviria sp.]